MYAFGICIDRHYLTPGLATITSLADSLSPRARKAAALRFLTFDLGAPQVQLLAHLAKRVGFGSFALTRRSPLRSAWMADVIRTADHHTLGKQARQRATAFTRPRLPDLERLGIYAAANASST